MGNQELSKKIGCMGLNLATVEPLIFDNFEVVVMGKLITLHPHIRQQ
jgi:hypothetical protein